MFPVELILYVCILNIQLFIYIHYLSWMKIRILMDILFFKEHIFIYKIPQLDWANWSKTWEGKGCMHGRPASRMPLVLIPPTLFFPGHDSCPSLPFITQNLTMCQVHQCRERPCQTETRKLTLLSEQKRVGRLTCLIRHWKEINGLF